MRPETELGVVSYAEALMVRRGQQDPPRPQVVLAPATRRGAKACSTA